LGFGVSPLARQHRPAPPGASAVIYGSVESKGIVFDIVADALRVPNTDLRLFGKSESFSNAA
jgi:formate-dependent phosphoribosylglycinamide formyltransferase (GAR transformylase)